MSGFMGDLSPKQAEALEQFKANIKDLDSVKEKSPYLIDDAFYLRWLRARRFDVKKSEKMLRESIDWRRKFGTDKILEWEAPEVLQKYYPGGYYGHDKQGYPNWFDTLGPVDLKGIMYCVKKSDIVKWKVYWIEKLYAEGQMFDQASKKFGKRIDQSNIIFDMEGIGMKHLWKPAIDMFTEILTVFEANYPETLKTCYVVNAPSIFPICYNLAKPFLSEDTKSKMRILGKSWKEYLLEDIDADQLPVNWGGSQTDPDGDKYCKSKICMGGKIPESYYMKKLDENVDMSQFTVTTVTRGSSLQVEQVVKEEGCILRWQFWTDGMDIGFGVFMRTADKKQKKDEMEEVVISTRVNSHVIPEDGSYTCEKIGTYVLRFDNTYSWMNQKKVSYMVELLDPDHSNELQITAL